MFDSSLWNLRPKSVAKEARRNTFEFAHIFTGKIGFLSLESKDKRLIRRGASDLEKKIGWKTRSGIWAWDVCNSTFLPLQAHGTILAGSKQHARKNVVSWYKHQF